MINAYIFFGWATVAAMLISGFSHYVEYRQAKIRGQKGFWLPIVNSILFAVAWILLLTLERA